MSDIHRRKVVKSSIAAKLASASVMVQSAREAAEQLKTAQQNNDALDSKNQAEAVYAAVSEALTSLETVRNLSVIIGAANTVKINNDFAEDVANRENNAN